MVTNDPKVLTRYVPMMVCLTDAGEWRRRGPLFITADRCGRRSGAVFIIAKVSGGDVRHAALDPVSRAPLYISIPLEVTFHCAG